MPIDIVGFARNQVERIWDIGIVNTVLSNPIYTAILLTCIILLIFLCSGEHAGFLWVLAISASIIFLHDKRIIMNVNSVQKFGAYESLVMEPSHNSIFNDKSILPIAPTLF